MNGLYPVNFHRRVERQWAERMKALHRIRAQIIDLAERMLPGTFNEPIPVKIRALTDRRERH